jgi:hypothetical protein
MIKPPTSRTPPKIKTAIDGGDIVRMSTNSLDYFHQIMTTMVKNTTLGLLLDMIVLVL